MRIAIVADEYPPVNGGIGRYSEEVVRFLARRHDVRVYLRDTGGRVAPASTVPVETIAYDPAARSARTLLARLQAHDIQTVLFNHVDLAGPFMVAGLRRAGLATGAFLYGADIGMHRPPRAHLRLWATLALHRHRIAISLGTLAVLRRRFRGMSAHLVRPGIASRPFVERAPGDGIVAVGRLVRRKGFDTLLHAAALLARRGLHPPVTVIGDGPDAPHLRGLAAQLGLERQVRWAVGLDDAAVREELRKHRVFCLLPRRMTDGNIEGFGIVFLEAAQQGLPVVAGDSGGVPDAVWPDETGYLVDPEQPEAAANRLAALLTDDALWRRQHERTRDWVDRFVWAHRDPAREFSFLEG